MRPLQPLPLQFPSLARILRRPTPQRRALRNPLPPKTRSRTRQPYSTSPPPPPPPNPTPNPTPNTPNSPQKATRLTRILSRLPPPLQRYTARLRGAPATHVVAFLLLHELTAVVPLLGLFGLFHYTEHVPVAWMVARYGGGVDVKEGVGRFERWFRRRGWFGFGDGDDDEEGGEDAGGEGGVGVGVGEGGVGQGGDGKGKGMVDADTVLSRWEADPKYRILVEVGLAYALTKVLLPVRIIGSVWATPWFAGVLGRLRKVVRRG